MGGRHVIIILTLTRIQENLGRNLLKNILTYQYCKLLSLIKWKKLFCWLSHRGTEGISWKDIPALKSLFLHWKNICHICIPYLSRHTRYIWEIYFQNSFNPHCLEHAYQHCHVIYRKFPLETLYLVKTNESVLTRFVKVKEDIILHFHLTYLFTHLLSLLDGWGEN